MSAEAVNQFLQKVAEDQSLQAELASVLGAPDDRDLTTQLAKQKGYDFTSDELWAEVQKRQAEFDRLRESGELEMSDEELESVSGGIIFTLVYLIGSAIATAVATSAGGGITYAKTQW
ncbi:Nif11-like leader peptide family RiPP precursor [Leptolyngbya sp. GGD]|uniref:Nif11-like leader peptide family RiPP precursor n=1 Tax=Leptolyngbya sp. GGD TaxID=2997907 RepID=UPI00227AFCAC|nr:Nif11-like leader peptide family RiPP precursor [Leptolyngbya sp. GGD]MCY6490360.1 Nif11-like leader peptide family RiPP precursor [Leptolyngbya sp. GGD]